MKGLKTLILSLMFVTLLFTNAYGEDAKKELDVKREKDKTVYEIGNPDCTKKKDTEEEDRKNSWDMLKNMNIRIDRR